MTGSFHALVKDTNSGHLPLVLLLDTIVLLSSIGKADRPQHYIIYQLTRIAQILIAQVAVIAWPIHHGGNLTKSISDNSD